EHVLGRDAPDPSAIVAIAASAFFRLDPHAKENKLARLDALLDQGSTFRLGLHKDAIRLTKQPEQGRGEVGFPAGIVGILRIAEMQKRSQQKRYAKAPGEPQAAGHRPGVWE